DGDEIVRQIRDFKEKGVDGFVLHPRLGIPREIPYLSETYFELVRRALEEARRLGMKVILYDEGMYPSGSANGQVVRVNPAYASRGLRMLKLGPAPKSGQSAVPLEEGDELVALVAAREAGEGNFDLPSARIISGPGEAETGQALYALIQSFTRGTIRGIHPGQDDGEAGAPPSADLLNEEAVNCFIRLTHERYFEELGPFFGSTVTAFFTDEPNIMGRGKRAHRFFPWTPGFAAECLAEGLSLAELPALFLEAGERGGQIRRRYEQLVYQRMNRVFYRPISRWCESRGIALTGHPESSEDIGLLDLFHIPGQDIVWRWVAPEGDKALGTVHSAAAKCASDAARHAGKSRNLNEVFGCCGQADRPWDFTLGDMKWYLDYLFVRGCNLIVPHAFYYSLRTPLQYGERPPDVGPGNIWWPWYGRIAAYIKRMSYLMTGVNQTELAVLSGDEHLPWRIVRPLFENQIEFNYLNRRALFKARFEDGLLRLGKQGYRVVLAEDEGLLDPQVLAALAPLEEAGGSLLRLGGAELRDIPALVGEKIQPAVRVLSPRPELRMTHVVLEGRHIVFLVNEGEEAIGATLSLALEGIPEIWDPWEGTCQKAACLREKGLLLVPVLLGRRESRVLVLAPASRVRIPRPPLPPAEDGKLKYRLSFDWAGPEDHARLEMGNLGDLAELRVNGVNAGLALWKPFALDIPVKPGENRLDIVVWESMANRYGTPVPAGLLEDIIISGI
ncbi:MAG: hypothetical protein LBH26_07075, partial [Treponema sp.]|nr:hypothetical protein [Treponema sp.]